MIVRADGHGCSLAQSCLQAPLVSSLMQESLLAIETAMLVAMAKDSSASRVLQTALSSSESDTAFRKRLIPKFYKYIVELAANPSGSYFVESLWEGTKDIHFMKEANCRRLGQTRIRAQRLVVRPQRMEDVGDGSVYSTSRRMASKSERA